MLIGLVLSQLTKHLINPTPMYGAIMIGVAVLVADRRILRPFAGVGPARGLDRVARRRAALVLLVLLVYGTIGFVATPFTDPHGVYVAPTGSVFVADTQNNRVVLISRPATARRSPVDGRSAGPADVIADGDPNGFVYIADAGNNRIVRLSGYYHYTVGSHTFNLALAAGPGNQKSLGVGLKDPQSVSVDGLGNLYVADTGNNRIVEINRKTGRQTTFLSGLSGPLAVLRRPLLHQDGLRGGHRRRRGAADPPERQAHVLLEGARTSRPGSPRIPTGNFYVSEMGSGDVKKRRRPARSRSC